MDLQAYPTDSLLAELSNRMPQGIIALSKGPQRVEFWWGNRVKCLGLSARLTSTINLEMDGTEDEEEDNEEDEAPSDIQLEFPQMGQYL